MTDYDLTTEAGILAHFQQPGSCFPLRPGAAITRLNGGSSAYVYRAARGCPFADNSRKPYCNSIVIKHAAATSSGTLGIELGQSRIEYEYKALQYLSEQHSRPPSRVAVPTPLQFDAESYTLVLADCGNLPTLRTWITQSISVSSAQSIGSALGSFLAGLHNATDRDATINFADFRGNVAAKQLACNVYYGEHLRAAVNRFGYNAAEHSVVVERVIEQGVNGVMEREVRIHRSSTLPVQLCRAGGTAILLPLPTGRCG